MKILFQVFNTNSNNKQENLTSDFLSFTETKNYKSIRGDYWTFKFNHRYINNTTGGKIFLDILVQKPKNLSNYKNLSHSSIMQILDTLTFNIDYNINYNSFRSHNSSISLEYEKLTTTQEISIPPETYSKPINNIFVVELLITKKFNNISNLNEGQFNGIANEGATCYMNSMLQTLYSIYPFKTTVFKIPTEKDDYSSIVLSLQRLFYDLFTNHSPVSARNLINSFGWTREQIQIQHDVQEFNQLLIEVMENKMKGTDVEGSFSKLFTGKYNNYIQCVNVEYFSQKEETFNELQLAVKGYNDIYQSFDAYSAEEILDNDDKYETDDYGKQKAIKRIKFLSFPPVLFLQLKRFEYNSKKEIMVKINDRFKYYDEIELSKYIDPKSEKNNIENNTYVLHSVIVHQGNANSGHYYAYIKQSKNAKDWLLFNDDQVRPADHYEIFKQNYGGAFEIFKNKGSQGEIVSNNINYERSAYILVYIQKSKQDILVSLNNHGVIPAPLQKRFENEKEDEKNAANKKKRDMENINIFLFSNINCLYHNNKLGIINSFIDLSIDAPFIYNLTSRLLINFPENAKIKEFIEFICKKTNIPKEEMLLFNYKGRQDFQILPSHNYDIIPIEDLDISLIEFKQKNNDTYITFFLYVREPFVVFMNSGSMKDLCEDYKIGNSDEKKSIIYIGRNYNKYSFKDNNLNNNNNHGINNISNNNNFNFSKNRMEIKKTRIIFIKEFDNERKELIFKKITDVNIDDKNIYFNIVNSYLHNNKHQILYFILENSYMINENDNFKFVIIDENNINNILQKMNSLILIPVYREEDKNKIIEYLIYLNKLIYIDINCVKCFGGEENILALNEKMKKIKIVLEKSTSETDLKLIIHQNLNEKKLLEKLCGNLPIYYLDNCKTINNINEDYLKQHINNYAINILQSNEKDNVYKLCGNEYNEFQIFKYINVLKTRINVELNLYKNTDLQEFYYQEFNIFDINNNYVSKLNALIPKRTRKASEILDYLKVFLNFYYGGKADTLHFFFLLQKKNYNYLYQIFTNNYSELKMYDARFRDIEYRLQPFTEEETMKIFSSEYKKIFISFAEYNNYLSPLVMYFKLDNDYKFIKSEIAKKIVKMKGYQELMKNKIGKVEFYIYRGNFSQDKIYPDKQLKEDDTIQSILKDTNGACNLLISFIKFH